ncbi:MAG: hypothetical protein HOW73_30335 [Polyangiaceae bacterium]|nr:hypothetical protein [Polyangiaceae bacterium]
MTMTMAPGVDAGSIREADAIRLVQGSAWERLRIGSMALGRLLRNPDDTAQVFLVGIALNAGSFPQLIARVVADEAGFQLAAEAPTIDSRSVDFDGLRALPADTLGGAYVRYLDDNKLDPDLFQPPPGLPKVPRWIAMRIRQTHDVWHTLTGYGPDVVGELCLQGFTYGQLGMPSSLAIATIGTVFRAPTAARRVLRGYQRGRRATYLPVVRFEDRWDRSLDDVRRELMIDPE